MDFQHSQSAKARGSKKKKNRNSSAVARQASVQQGSGDNELCNSLMHCNLNDQSVPQPSLTEVSDDVLLSNAVLSSRDVLIENDLCQILDSQPLLNDCSVDELSSLPSRQPQLSGGVARSVEEAGALCEKSQPSSAIDFCSNHILQHHDPIFEHKLTEQCLTTDSCSHQDLEQKLECEQKQDTQHSLATDLVQLSDDRAAPPANLLKSYRDLQRQMTSLIRLQSLCASRTSCAKVSIHAVFDKLHTALSCREAELVANIDDIQWKTKETLGERLRMAQILKALVDRSHNMSSEEHEHLRTNIKSYISERGVDQTIGSADRFTFSVDDVTQQISSFGCVNPIAADYSYMFADFSPDCDDWAQFLSRRDSNNIKYKNDVQAKSNDCKGMESKHPKELLPLKMKQLQDKFASDRQMSCSPLIDHISATNVTCTSKVDRSSASHSGEKVEEIAGVVQSSVENGVKCNGSSQKCAETPFLGSGTFEKKRSPIMYCVDGSEDSNRGSICSIFSRSYSVNGVANESTNGHSSFDRTNSIDLSADDENVEQEIKNYLKLINEDLLRERAVPFAENSSSTLSGTHSSNAENLVMKKLERSSVEVKCSEDSYAVKLKEAESQSSLARGPDATKQVSLSTPIEIKNTRGIIHISAIEANLGSSGNYHGSHYHSRGGRDGHSAPHPGGRRHSGSMSFGNSGHHDVPRGSQQYRYGVDRPGYGYKAYSNGRYMPGRTAGQSSRRSVSYSTDNAKVDEDGFTLVKHGRHDSAGGGQNGGRSARGSSGDVTTKFFYANDSSYGSRSAHNASRDFHQSSQSSFADKVTWD